MVLRYSWEAINHRYGFFNRNGAEIIIDFEEYPEVLKRVKELSFVRKQQLNKK